MNLKKVHSQAGFFIIQRWYKAIAQHSEIFPLLGLNSLMYISLSTLNPYIGAYFLSRGISVAEIGVITAIGPIITIIAQPLWGFVSDKTSRHMFFLRIAITGSMLSVLIYLAMSDFLGFLIAISIFALFNCGIIPLADTVAVSRISERGYRFSTIRLGGTVGFAVSVFLAGKILRNNPSLSFILTSSFYFIMLLVTFKVPKSKSVTVKRRKLELKKLYENRLFFFILAVVFVFQIAMGFHASFLGVFITELGYDNSIIGLLWCVAALSEVPVLLVIDRVLHRVKLEVMLIAAGFVVALRHMLLPLIPTLGGLIITQCLQGLSYMVMHCCTIMYIGKNFDKEVQGTAIAVLYVVQMGLGSLFSNIIGGQIGQHFGLKTGYLIYASVTFICNLGFIGYLILRKRASGK